jgi:hypothetical protein
LAYNGELHVIIKIMIMDNTVGSLTNLEKSIIIGSILGDGYLRIIPDRTNAFLEINHSFKAKDYVDYKFNSLKRICSSEPEKREINNRVAYRFFTKQHPELTKLYKEFYRQGKKIIPNNLILDPIILAVWYMDDGSKTSNNDIYLNTQQFSLRDQKKLLSLLKKMKINARLNKDKKYYRIRILKQSVMDFMEIINPHMETSMKYKLVMTL